MCSFSQILLLLSSEIAEPRRRPAGAVRSQLLQEEVRVVNYSDGVSLLCAKKKIMCLAATGSDIPRFASFSFS